jgi:hypothetical protein
LQYRVPFLLILSHLVFFQCPKVCFPSTENNQLIVIMLYSFTERIYARIAKFWLLFNIFSIYTNPFPPSPWQVTDTSSIQGFSLTSDTAFEFIISLKFLAF